MNGRSSGGCSCARVDGAASNPLLEVCKDRIGKFSARRHLGERIAVPEGGHQPAFGRFAWNEDWTGNAALQQSFLTVEHEVALRRRQLGVVAAVALLHEDRPNFGLEKLDVWRLCKKRCARRNRHDEADDAPTYRHGKSPEASGNE